MRTNGHWDHTTVFDVPAHSLVHVTIYNFDGASGLRNPFLSQVQGTVGGNMRVNGKPIGVDPASDCLAHVLGARRCGITVPIQGVDDDAKNQCAEMPCSLDEGARDHHLHDPHRQAGALSLAVLRALRRRIHRRIRGADADDRLHGRLHSRDLRHHGCQSPATSAAS